MLDLELDTPRGHRYRDGLVECMGGDWPLPWPEDPARDLDPDAFAALAAKITRGLGIDWWWANLYLLPEINARAPMGTKERKAWLGVLFDPLLSPTGPRTEERFDGLLERSLEWAEPRWSVQGLTDTLAGSELRDGGTTLETHLDWVIYGALLRHELPWMDTLEALEEHIDPPRLCALAWGLGPCAIEDRGRAEAFVERMTAAIPTKDWRKHHVLHLLRRAPHQPSITTLIDTFLTSSNERDGDYVHAKAMLWTDSRERFDALMKTRTLRMNAPDVLRVYARWGVDGVAEMLEVGLKRKRKRDTIHPNLLKAFHDVHAPEVVMNLFPYDDPGSERAEVVGTYLSDAPAEHVAHGLIACCNRAGKKRTWAVERMRALLERDGGREALEGALTQWKKKTADFVRAEVLDHEVEERIDLDDAPEWIRALARRGETEEMPIWFGEGELTPLVLSTGGVLPDACARGLLLHSITTGFEDDETEWFTRESLNALGLELMNRWCNARRLAPSNERVQTAQSPMSWLQRFPSPATVAALESYIRTKKHPNRYGKEPEDCIRHAARQLVAIDSTEALAATLRLAESERSPAHSTAKRAVEAAMKRLNVNRGELAHIATPTFGLNARGERDFDYGSRTIRLRLNGQQVTYEDLSTGKVSTRAPKGNRKDDVDEVEAARAQMALVHKPLTAELERHATLFEEDMVLRVAWKGAHWKRRIVGHGLLGPLATRLVWRIKVHGEPTRYARPTADGSLIDAAMDDAPEVPDDASVVLAHPWQMGEELTPWSEHFGSFELTQPFEQLDRLIPDWDSAAMHLLEELQTESAHLDPVVLRKLMGPRAGELIESSYYGKFTSSYSLKGGKLVFRVTRTKNDDRKSPLRFACAKKGEHVLERTGKGAHSWAKLDGLVRAEALRVLTLARTTG